MLGAYTAKEFLADGWTVTLLDRSINEDYLHDILGDVGGVTTIQVDLSDEAETAKVLSGLRPDAVVNTAALVAARAQLDPLLTVDVNIRMPLRLAMWAHEVGTTKFVSISSFGIYAADQQSRITENSPIMSPHVSHYGASKAAMESVLGAFAVASGLRTAVVRPVIIYGYGPNLGGGIASAIVEDLVVTALRGKPVVIPPGMTSQSEYIYVGDVARIVFRAATLEGSDLFEVFNAGSQRTTSTEQFAAALRSLFPSVSIAEAPRDDTIFGPPRQSHATDMTKTIARLGIPTPLALADGFSCFVDQLRRAAHLDDITSLSWK